MIQVSDLSIAYLGVPLFENVNFSLQKGEKIGLIGRNGSGKSTLLKLITGKETPDSGIVTMPKGYQLGMMDQHISFSRPTLLEEAALGLKIEDKDHLFKVEKVLSGLGFKESQFNDHPEQFSGGYQLRLHLAKVLLREPDCLLLDEPTNYLDIVSIRWFQRFLQNWQGECLLISHDRAFMDAVTTHTMGIRRSQVKKMKGSSLNYYQQILFEEEIYEKTREKVEKKRQKTQQFIDRFGAKATKAGQAQSRKKMLARNPIMENLSKLENLSFSFRESPFKSKIALQARDVAFSYSLNEPLIHDFNFVLENGGRIAIIGKNGRGKSTLLKLLSSELCPLQGSVDLSENLEIGFFGQTNIDRLHHEHTIFEEISQENPILSVQEVKQICGLMMFGGDRSEKPISVLSGGERSRVLLGKILAKPCNLLLLDEPTHHLDAESIEALLYALEDFSGAIVIVTHSELLLHQLNLDKVVICKEKGQEEYLGTYQDFLDKKGWDDEKEIAKGAKTEGKRLDRRKRAEILAAKSKALKPIKDKIRQTETNLQKEEKKQNLAHTQLAVLSGEGKSEEIQKLSIKISNRQKNIDNMYEELDRLLTEKETIEKEFNNQS